MYENRSQSRDGGRGARDQGDDPPMSRLFIICNKAHTEEDFREAFSQFGDIEDIWVVKDKHTGESKGITYIKYAKTSQAARAQEEMNGKTIGSLDRTLKVLVAASRNQGSTKSDNEHEKYVRLFIVCPKTATEDELRDEFSKWGQVENVTLLRDKQSGNPKGFGYIRYSKFLDAAIALENCPAKYKPVFAEPKDSGRSLSSRDDNTMMGGRGGGGGGGGRGSGNMMKDNMGFGGPSNNFGAGMGGGGFNNMPSGGGSYNNWGNSVSSNKEMAQFLRLQNVPVPNPTCLEVIISNCVNQDQLWHLFNIIPGLNNCKILRECGPRTNEAIVVYDSPEAAIYARDKLHGLEYPAGERIIAKVSGMSSARIDTSFIDKRTKMDAVCNVPLPPVEPMAPADAQCAQRLFIVLTSNVPMSILKNVFSCWRGLMDVYLLPNKNCGYVKYANKNSAINAMQTLHGAEICGTRIKVLEAEERDHNNDDGDGNRKRMRRN